MQLMEEISNVKNSTRGITLNTEQIELFDLLGTGTQEDKENVYNYLKKLESTNLNNTLLYLLQENENSIDATYEKVKLLYEYITGKVSNGELRFNSITLENQGKFQIVADGIKNDKTATIEDYNLDLLIQAYKFAQKHGMKVRISNFINFEDFPDRLIDTKEDDYRTALLNYGTAVASVVKEYTNKFVYTTIDMFSNIISPDKPFEEKQYGWMKKLRVEDLCEIALEIKTKMPNADIGYSDNNFENPLKRRRIYEVLTKIRAFEKKNHYEYQVMNHIGMEINDHIDSNVLDSIHQISQFDVPIDVSVPNENYQVEQLVQLLKEKQIRSVTIQGANSSNILDKKACTCTKVNDYEER